MIGIMQNWMNSGNFWADKRMAYIPAKTLSISGPHQLPLSCSAQVALRFFTAWICTTRASDFHFVQCNTDFKKSIIPWWTGGLAFLFWESKTPVLHGCTLRAKRIIFAISHNSRKMNGSNVISTTFHPASTTTQTKSHGDSGVCMWAKGAAVQS